MTFFGVRGDRAAHAARAYGVFGSTLALLAAIVAGAPSCSSTHLDPVSADAGVADAAVLACDSTRTQPPDVGTFSIDAALPDVAFTALAADRTRADFTLHERYLPCRTEPKFLVLRIGATWCEPCKIAAASTSKWRGPEPAGSVEVIDVLLANAEQQVPTAADVAAWRVHSDADVVASTAERRWFALDTAPNHMPYTIIIEKRSMHVVSLGHGWGWQEYPQRLGALFERYKRENPWRSFVPPALHDGLFDESEWAVIEGMAWHGEPVDDPSNRVATSPLAAELGRRLFFDETFSSNGAVSCASCHAPEKNFGDDRPQSVGLAKVDRHAPNVALASYKHAQFWDGRADSLWMQALGPLENAKEMGSSRGTVVGRVAASHRAAYEAVFGSMPALSTDARLVNAMPGTVAWDALATDEKSSVTGVFVNIGKSIAAYERTLRVRENALDRYARGDVTALTDPERKGLEGFLHAGCAQCHAGPLLTDDAYHVLRFPTGRQDGLGDRGRIDAFAFLEGSEFNGAGVWSDLPVPLALPADRDRLLGAFKTPTLRGVASRGQFGHGGTLATIEDLAKHYSERGLKDSDAKAVGTVDAWLPEFDTGLRDSLVPFLKVLKGDSVDSLAPP